MVAALFVEINRIMNFRTAMACAGNAVSDRHRLHGMNRQDGLADSAVQLFRPLHVRSESDRHAVRSNDNGSAEGLTGFARVVDGLHHRTFVLAFHGAQRRIIIDGRELFPRRRIFRIARGTERDDAGSDLDAECA